MSPVVPPVLRQEFLEPALQRPDDAGEHVGEPDLGIDTVELGSADQRAHGRRAPAPRSKPANSQERLPRARGPIAHSAVCKVDLVSLRPVADICLKELFTAKLRGSATMARSSTQARKPSICFVVGSEWTGTATQWTIGQPIIGNIEA